MGCKSLIPRKVLVDGRVRLGAVGSDAYVRPECRGSGVATRLHLAANAEMAGQGVGFAPGVPVASSRGGLIRAGARQIAPFQRWTTFIGGERLLRRGLGRTPPSQLVSAATVALEAARGLLQRRVPGLAMQPLDPSRPDLESLAQRMMSVCSVACVRDGAYLAWRYGQAPGQHQTAYQFVLGARLAAVGALEIEDERAMVVDLFGAPEPRLAASCLLLMLDLARQNGALTLELFTTAGSALARLLPRLGFLPREQTPMIVTADPHDPQAATLLERPWLFTLGDLDGDAYLSGPSF